MGAMMPAQQVQAPGVATSPYGVLPEPPRVREDCVEGQPTCVVHWGQATDLMCSVAAQPSDACFCPLLMPPVPQVSPAPEYKVGLTQRPAGLLSGGPPRPAALITPRSITPRSGVRMRPRRSMSATRMSKSPADFLAAAAAAGTPGSAAHGGDGRSSATPQWHLHLCATREPSPPVCT